MSAHLLRPTLILAASVSLAACTASSAVSGTASGAMSAGDRSAPSVIGDTSDLSFPEGSGVMVMAHGGTEAWNDAVSQAVAPLRSRVPVAVAFGMADPTTLQAALDSLAERGASRVAVVRLFLSGDSFLHQTEYLLGFRPDPPAHPLLMRHGGGHGGHGAGDGGAVEFAPLRSEAPLVLQRSGLSEHGLSWRIVEERAVERSTEPSSESVLVLAHGAGDDTENAMLLARMEGAVNALEARGFGAAAAFTLREDWPEARAESERRIRAWVEARQAAGDRVLVVPYRLFGFGPYASVLEGLDHVAGEGLLPHPLVARFVEETAAQLLAR